MIMHRRPTRIFLMYILPLIALVAIGTSVYLYIQNNRPEAVRVQEENDREQAKLLRELGAILLVPNETPQIATITSKEALTQPFFKDAENGDKLLLFETARKAVLYRPSVRKIVNIESFQLNQAPSASPTPQAQPQ